VSELDGVFAPEVVAAIERLVDERVAAALAARAPATPSPRWLTVEQAAERLGCSRDAVRMRVRRGRLDSKRSGRRVYVSTASVDALGGAS
jgi:excisionase family DNA binding protein